MSVLSSTDIFAELLATDKIVDHRHQGPPEGLGFEHTNLEIEHFGKSFKEIDETFHDRIRYCHIHTIPFMKESQPELKFVDY